MYLKYLQPSDVAKIGNAGISEDDLQFKYAKISRFGSYGGFVGFDFADKHDAYEFHMHIIESLKATMFNGKSVEIEAYKDGFISVRIPIGYMVFMGIMIKDDGEQ